MKAQSDFLAIENLAWPAHQVWQELRRRFYDDNNPHVVRGLSERQVVQHAVQFFQFHYITINQEDFDKPTRLIGWAHPALVALLRYHGTTVFVDDTFRCVPRGFAQCVVFMVHDHASGVSVPVSYILGTSRTADAYWDMIHFVAQATDLNLEPAEVICDFEAALMNSIQTGNEDALP
ncbi:unnamed protein product [Phytophthora lilii]|uniref:Unnamed protein product n=1 Tax=Phytophthora lilii TaxID=2077276 RepID=A0A9W6XID2_9STRA|nr:unnamed protein product [Phytophthora lilii]